MKRILDELWLLLFPPISRRRALDVAEAYSESDRAELAIFRRKPENCHIYSMPTEPSWFVYVPWNDGKDGMILCSSRILLISKRTGEILYDGGAGDEG